jgi:hypothetical protein
MIVFLVTFGKHEHITLGPVFTNRDAAEAYKRMRDETPQQTLGPIAPINIIECDVFGRIEDAIAEGH